MYGMHFTGLVKTATTKLPMDRFYHHEYKEQGDHHVLTATINGHPYMACGWSDNTRKHFISTHKTTLEGNPHGKWCWHEIKEAQGSKESVKVQTACVLPCMTGRSLIRNCLEYSAKEPQCAVNLTENNRV